MSKTENFYKLAKLDGFDFYTGKTINYRGNIGKTVKCPQFNVAGNLCSDAFIHASRKPNDCFVGASIPCSAYRVSGKLIKEDKVKCGFKELTIIEELKPETLFKWNYKEACNPINPLKIIPPKKITKEHIQLLNDWDSVWDSVRDSVGAPVGAPVGASVWASVWASVCASVGNSVGASVRDSVWNSVWDSVGASVWDSVWDSVGNSVWDSVGASVGAYIGSIFIPIISSWQKKYSYQSVVDLWKMGLVPSFDGKKWRLHGGKKAEILWEGTLKAARQIKAKAGKDKS